MQRQSRKAGRKESRRKCKEVQKNAGEEASKRRKKLGRNEAIVC
jgi:hypothetical protein